MRISSLVASKRLRQVLALYTSTLVGVFLGFVASIINTNALDPAAYGDVRYVQNIIQLLSWLLLFGYFLSGSRLLALENDEEKRREIRGVLVIILGVICLGTALLDLVIGLFHSDAPTGTRLFLYSIPVCFYPVLINYLNTTAQGDNHIGRLSVARLLPHFVYIVVAYYLYKTCVVTSALMLTLQWGIYSLVLFGVIASTKPKFRNIAYHWNRLKVENLAYGRKLYYGSLAMVATNYLPGFTLGLFDSDNVNVGFYTLALTLTTPLSYLPAIVGTTYFKQFVNEPQIPDKVFRFTLLVTVCSCICFILLINPLVSILYRDDYAQVGVYASWMAVGFAFHGLGDMINRFLGSHGIGTPIMNSSIACGLVKVVGYFLLVYFWGIEGALITTILSSMVYCVCLYFYYRRIVPIKKS